MATKKNLEEINKLIKEVQDAYRKLSLAPPLFDESKITVKELKKDLESSESLIEDMSNNAGDLATAYRAVVEEAGKGNDAYNSSKKSLNSLVSMAGQLRDHQAGSSDLSSKELQSLKSKTKSQQANLVSQQAILAAKEKEGKISPKELSMLGEINGLLGDKGSLLNSNLDIIDKEGKKRKSIEKQLGVAGGVLKGISKIPILGDVFNADETLGEMTDHLKEGGSAAGALGKGLKNVATQAKDGLLNTSNLLLGGFGLLVDIVKDLDAGAGKFAKSMNMSYGEALEVRKEMSSIAVFSGDAALNSANLTESLGEVGAALGTNAALNEKDLKTFTKLKEQAGFTADELMGIQKLSLANGKSLDHNVKSIMGGGKAFASQNKLALNQKKILKDVNGMSASLKLSLKGGEEALGAAAAQAMKFGINLAQAEGIASNLLDFESSIENELAAELLLGKDLNLEKARGLALSGEASKAAAEVLKQVGSASEFGDLGVIQQQALAKAVGMTKDELAASLIESEALQSIGAATAEEAKEKYDLLRLSTEEGGKGLNAAQAAKELGDEELALQYEQQSITEEFANQMMSLKETLINGILPGFMKMATFLKENLGLIKSIVKVMVALKVAQITFLAVKKIGLALSKKETKEEKKDAAASMFSGSFKSLGTIPFVGMVLATAAAIGAIALMNSMVADDAFSPGGGGGSGYGNRTLMGPEGAIQLNNKDDVIAGTDLFGKKKQNTNTPQGTSVNVDMTQTNALLQQLIQVLTAGGDVLLDGQKVGEAIGLTAYKIN